MLERLTLTDWKSFGAGEGAANTVEFGRVTLLVGPNGSGKSNVLDALRFLQGAVLDIPLVDVLRGHSEGQREVWPAIRGGLAEAARHGADGFALETDWHFREFGLRHTLRVGTNRGAGVDHEALTIEPGSIPLFTTRVNDSRWMSRAGFRAAMDVALDGAPQMSEESDFNPYRAAISQIQPFLGIDRRVPRAIGMLRVDLGMAAFLDIQPARMRDYRPEGGGSLGSTGENISPTLLALSQQPGEPLADIVDWLSELCAPAITTIDFDRTQLREVMLFVVERSGARVSARSLSDGTLRFLGVLTALLTCEPGTLIVLEEPDVGLHPSRIHLLASLLEDIARKRDLQILATTHSPTLLANLSKETLGDVVAFGRDPGTGLSKCARLRDLPHFETLRGSTHMEELISKGWLEREL